MENKTAVTALAALAQETRLSIFRTMIQVGSDGLTAGKISETLGTPPSSLSFHLKELVYPGLIKSRKSGQFRISQRVSLSGRLNSVTNGRFQVSEFNDSFPAMNLKSGRSPGDPNQSIDS
jgi:DNA-binding transcriptional ArsR family regulator